MAWPLVARGRGELPHRLELVVAREDHRLGSDLAALVVPPLVDLEVDKAGEEVENAVSLEDLLPEVGRPVGPPGWVGRVAGPTVAAAVERQEVRCSAAKSGGHQHRLGVDREVHQRAALELEDRLVGVPVALVLRPGVLDGLSGERVLELERGERDAVEAQGDVEGVLGTRGVAELPREAEPVRGVARLELGVQLVRRPEVGDLKRPPVALEAVPEGRQRAVRVHPLAEVAEDLIPGLLAVQRFESRPLLRLGLLDERQDLAREDRSRLVERLRLDGDVPMPQEVRFDDRLEGCLRVPAGLQGAPTRSSWTFSSLSMKNVSLGSTLNCLQTSGSSTRFRESGRGCSLVTTTVPWTIE